MADPTRDPSAWGGLLDAWLSLRRSMPESFWALLLAGVAGAYVRAVFMPETAIMRRILEATAGVLSALTLGQLMGHVVNEWIGGDQSAYLACGFIMGEGGISAVRGVRRAIFRRFEK